MRLNYDLMRIETSFPLNVSNLFHTSSWNFKYLFHLEKIFPQFWNFTILISKRPLSMFQHTLNIYFHFKMMWFYNTQICYSQILLTHFKILNH